MHPEKKKRSLSSSHKSRSCVSVSCKKKKEEEVGVHPRKRRRWGMHPAKKEEEMPECIPGNKKSRGADAWVDPG